MFAQRKSVVFLLNFNPLRGSRCICLKAVPHHESYHVYLVGKVLLSLISHDKTESWLKKIQRYWSYPLNSCFDLRDFFFLLSLRAVFFFISDDLSSNENASYSKGFIKVDSELLLVRWVFKLQILYSKSSLEASSSWKIYGYSHRGCDKFNMEYKAVSVVAFPTGFLLALVVIAAPCSWVFSKCVSAGPWQGKPLGGCGNHHLVEEERGMMFVCLGLCWWQQLSSVSTQRGGRRKGWSQRWVPTLRN